MALTPLTDPLGIKRAAHLLRRATFDADKGTIELFSTMTPEQALPFLFYQNIPDPILPIDPATGAEWVTTGRTDANSEESTLQAYFKRWLVGQALRNFDLADSEKVAYNVREKLTFFMHTHFTTKVSKVNSSRSLYFQNQLFRQFAFDQTGDAWKNFRELTKKICIDNAMLQFLDGRQNVKGNPNENFGRELLELYAIGRGLEGTLPGTNEPGDYVNYTEQDVQAAARVLSGFTIDDSYSTLDIETGLPRGIARGIPGATAHDNDTKQFSNRFNNQEIAPDPLLTVGEATEESALDEISQLIDMIYEMPETARYICRKLYRFYVYYDITQEIDDTIIADMASTFTSNNFRIQPVLEQLFSSTYFYEGDAAIEDDHFGAIIKSPMDLAVGTIRLLNISVPDYATQTEEFYSFTGYLLDAMESQGMNLYEPFEVAGYSAYHQFPIFNRSWISTNYLTNRYDFIRTLIAEPMTPDMPGINVLDYISMEYGGVAANARELIKALAKIMLPLSESLEYDDTIDDTAELTAKRLNYFLFAFLYSPQLDADPEGLWTERWNSLMERDVIVSQLENLLNAMMQSPEYQLA